MLDQSLNLNRCFIKYDYFFSLAISSPSVDEVNAITLLDKRWNLNNQPCLQSVFNTDEVGSPNWAIFRVGTPDICFFWYPIVYH